MAKLTEMPRPVSDRIMTMRIPLTKDQNAPIVSACAPTMENPEGNKEAFYSQLKGTLRNILSTDKLLLIGDFNARIGRSYDKWPSVFGMYGIGKCNSNNEHLLTLYTEFDLIMTNTMFKQKDAHNILFVIILFPIILFSMILLSIIVLSIILFSIILYYFIFFK